ncbi:cytochrome c oxidase cbb3-type subunit 3 [Mesobacillus persicus]|uniref:Cytochrome c oxidase cbb3-type subunit 3 n=1 Tax=Mesobacillus persicus TaxID=930146 RepID=A0A1H7W0X3_9BACI|nr:cytochrome c [Mesobacillus persicus]SEM15141.1 cytochrome c oxidase cbb3-type subunit 3 [Mesobacillus persicus]
MKKWLIALGVFISVVIIVLLSPSPDFKPQAETNLIVKGERIYSEYCVDCHGENGKGEGAQIGTALNNQHFLSTFSNKDIFKIINEGKEQTMMPQFGFLEEDNINALVSFIRNWQTDTLELEAPSVIEGNASNGRRLYNLYCITCHGETGSGTLTKAAAIGNPITVENMTPQQMWISTAYGREETRMGPSLKGQDGVRQLDEQEISDVITYIRQDLVQLYDPKESKHSTHAIIED